MLRFRSRPSAHTPGSPTDLFAVSEVIDDALRPANFLVAPNVELTQISARAESIRWEIFRGRLLEPEQTRLQRLFLSWHVSLKDDPLLSLRLDVQGKQIHVTRSLLCHAWDAFDAGGGIIDSKEAVKWVSELVGTVALDCLGDLDDARDELTCLLWQALVGSSRLPLTSVEAPLPAFSLGKLHYFYRPETIAPDSANGFDDAARMQIADRELVKLLEFALRQNALANLEDALAKHRMLKARLPSLLRSLFNEASLSPYTSFVETTLGWIDASSHLGSEERLDVLGYILRQLGRHLKAYDLVTFHHRGANYPDALLLDGALKAYLRGLEAAPKLFEGEGGAARLRRRALRQGCLARDQYHGHLVPDVPTSPGENARVMTPEIPRVPEGQLTLSSLRQRALFAGDPTEKLLREHARRIFAQSICDLDVPAERAELGTGLFIDRPLGYSKAPGEPDQTPLLAHEAFSVSQMTRSLQQLQRFCCKLNVEMSEDTVGRITQGPTPDGLQHRRLAECPRPAAALADVRRVADDFVILRTLPTALTRFLALFDWAFLLQRFRLAFLLDGTCRRLVQTLGERNQPRLTLDDAYGQTRLEMLVNVSERYVCRAGVELPRAGLHVVTVWDHVSDLQAMTRHDVSEAPIPVPLRG